MCSKLFAFFLIQFTFCASKVTGSAELDLSNEYDSMPQLFQFDDFHKCLQQKNQTFYCWVTIQLKPLNSKNASRVWSTIKKVSSNKNNYRHDLLRHGLCVSDYNEIKETYNEKYENLGLEGEVVETRCETKNSGYIVATSEVVLLAILGSYVFFVLLVSVYVEVVKYRLKNNQDSKVSKVLQFFSMFSIFDNIRYLLNSKSTKDNKNYMLFVDGIRFVAVVGVVVTHATEISVITPVSNPSYTETVPKRFITMILANGGMTVQVYFVISAWLLALSFFEKVKTEAISLGYVVKYVVRRYFRLTPAYALLIGLHSTWLVQLARGPFWDPIMGEDYRVCRKNWWKNLLYFNNFVIDDGLCMFHSWYLSVDFQFTILGLLILWMSQKKPKAIFWAAGLLITFQIVFLFYVLYSNNFEFAVVLTPELLYYFKLIYSKEWQATWTTTYSNLAPLVIGLCFGYVYKKREDKQIFTKHSHTILWWFFSWGLILAPLLFSSYYMTTEYYSNTRWFAATYGSVCKIFFAFGIALLIFGMSQGPGGYVKKCLEWPGMYTLGQLSFGAYLVHFTVLKVQTALREGPPYSSDYSMASEIITNVTMSYLWSAVLTVLVLMPCVGLSKCLIK